MSQLDRTQGIGYWIWWNCSLVLTRSLETEKNDKKKEGLEAAVITGSKDRTSLNVAIKFTPMAQHSTCWKLWTWHKASATTRLLMRSDSTYLADFISHYDHIETIHIASWNTLSTHFGATRGKPLSQHYRRTVKRWHASDSKWNPQPSVSQWSKKHREKTRFWLCSDDSMTDSTSTWATSVPLCVTTKR